MIYLRTLHYILTIKNDTSHFIISECNYDGKLCLWTKKWRIQIPVLVI